MPHGGTRAARYAGTMRKGRGKAALILVALAATGLGAAVPSWRGALPRGLDRPPAPAENPLTPAKVALGRRLFYDPALSVAGTMSCATCHVQARAFADATVTPIGIGGDRGRRNVPSLANVAWRKSYTWADPRVQTLEQQAVTPLFRTHPIEMGLVDLKPVAARLARDACYRRMFRAAYPAREGAFDLASITGALASFQRTLVSYRSPYDAYGQGDEAALSPAARRGLRLFTANCAGCHAGRDFTDDRFHAVVALDPADSDRGLRDASGRLQDDGQFRTPTLRNARLTAPYLHDGSAATIQEAVRAHRGIGGRLSKVGLDDLDAFVDALTDSAFVTDPAFSRPTIGCSIAG